MTYWSQEQIELVKKYWEQGMSSGMIAAMFPGKTRNSIIGIVHRNRNRLQISSRATVVSKRPDPKPKVAAPRRELSVSVIQKKMNNHFKNAAAKIRVEAEPPPQAYSAGNKTILKLSAFDCRAIIGEPNAEKTIYCGSIVMAGTSWCKHHFELYTVKQEKKNVVTSKASKRDTFGAFQFGNNG